jgi:hypothetical protein
MRYLDDTDNLRGNKSAFAQCADAFNCDHESTPDRCLIVTLRHFYRRESQIPRDRIYSILSLCKPGERIKVDYQLPDVDLFYNGLKESTTPVCVCHALLIGHCLEMNKSTRPRRIGVTEPYLELKIYQNKHVPTSQRYSQIPPVDVLRDAIREACPVMNWYLRVENYTHTLPPDSVKVLQPRYSWQAFRVRVEFQALTYPQWIEEFYSPRVNAHEPLGKLMLYWRRCYQQVRVSRGIVSIAST